MRTLLINFFSRRVFYILIFFITFLFIVFIFLVSLLHDLPSYKELVKYAPSKVTRLYTIDGKFLYEYAKQRRVYVRYNNIPKIIISAFIVTEDKNFFDNKGIEYNSTLRAFLQNLFVISKNKELVGGSTITQQVIKNFFLQVKKRLKEN